MARGIKAGISITISWLGICKSQNKSNEFFYRKWVNSSLPVQQVRGPNTVAPCCSLLVAPWPEQHAAGLVAWYAVMCWLAIRVFHGSITMFFLYW